MNLILLKNYQYYAEAEMAAGLLKNNNIRCLIQKGDGNAAVEFTSFLEANLYVSKNNYEKAKEILCID